jgi:hypothetical protein
MDKHINMKKCNKCDVLKLENEFYITSRTSTCKECHLEITREYKRKKREDSNYREIEGVKQKERRVRLWQNTLIHDCKGRKYDINIDVDYINELFEKQNGKCYWFGVDLIPTEQKKHPQQPSLDRLDTTKGYIKGNVVLSCYSANIGRNETNVSVWMDFLNKIKPIINYEYINI